MTISKARTERSNRQHKTRTWIANCHGLKPVDLDMRHTADHDTVRPGDKAQFYRHSDRAFTDEVDVVSLAQGFCDCSLVHGSAAVEIFRYGYLEVAVSDDRIEQFTVADLDDVTRPG